MEVLYKVANNLQRSKYFSGLKVWLVNRQVKRKAYVSVQAQGESDQVRTDTSTIGCMNVKPFVFIFGVGNNVALATAVLSDLGLVECKFIQLRSQWRVIPTA